MISQAFRFHRKYNKQGKILLSSNRTNNCWNVIDVSFYCNVGTTCKNAMLALLKVQNIGIQHLEWTLFEWQ